MFVAQLDRSWLETPFIERGFVVSKLNEIALLRKFCTHVYVDVERSSLPEKKIWKAHHQSGAAGDPFTETFIRRRRELRSARQVHGFLGALRKLNPVGRSRGTQASSEGLARIVSTRAEAPQAAAAFGFAAERMREILTYVKNGYRIDIDLIKSAVDPMIDSVMRNPDALAWYGALRKREDGIHSYSMTAAIWALILGRHLGFERHRLQNLAMGGLLLNIGNLRIPRSVGKKDAPLTEDEHKIIRMHVDRGVEIVKKSSAFNEDVIDMVRCHHERFDGSGYPNGLQGNDIPVYGRIAGVIDAYDAIISCKPYRGPKCAYDAVRELNQLSGDKFQVEVIEQFVQALGMFPTGSLVELNTGEVAIVIEQNRERRLRPNLLMILDANKQPVSSNGILALAKVPESGTNRKARWIVGGYDAGTFDIDPKDYFFGLKGAA
ncbi:MAG: HD-GYP domain-containing protein [Gammaproteobacteria bacterium]|nr:HD-GYP domain-containing protein [Gammaproteobacteria bacterium]